LAGAPCWGSSERSPRSPSWILGGPASKGRADEKGRAQEGSEGQEGKGQKGKGDEAPN